MSDLSSPPLRLGGPGELLSAVPLLVGFRPTESLVVLVLRGPRRRLGLLIRLDLPAAPERAEVVDQVRRAVRRADGDAAVLVVYTEDPGGEDGLGRLPQRALVDALGRTVEVDDALLVRGGRSWSYLCRDACCPPGSPLPTQVRGAAAQLAATSVAQGRALLPDRATLEQSVVPRRGPQERERWAQHVEEASAEVARDESGGGGGAAERTVELLREALAVRADGGPALPEQVAARILVGLRDVRARDRAVTLALGADPAVYLSVLVELSRCAEPEQAAPVCTVLACAAYLRGDGALANVALARALDAEPASVLAGLLVRALGRQVPPAEVRELLLSVQRDLDASAGGDG